MAANPSSGQLIVGAGVLASVKRFKARSAAVVDLELIAAVAGKALRITSLFVSSGTTTATFALNYDSDSGVALDSLRELDSYSGYALAFNPAGHFIGNTGSAITCVIEGAGSVSVSGTYCEV